MKNQNNNEVRKLFSLFLSNLIIKTIKQAHQIEVFNLEQKNIHYQYRHKINDLIVAANILIDNSAIQKDKKGRTLVVKLENSINNLLKSKSQIEEKIVNAQNILDEIYKLGFKVE